MCVGSWYPRIKVKEYRDVDNFFFSGCLEGRREGLAWFEVVLKRFWKEILVWTSLRMRGVRGLDIYTDV